MLALFKVPEVGYAARLKEVEDDDEDRSKYIDR